MTPTRNRASARAANPRPRARLAGLALLLALAASGAGLAQPTVQCNPEPCPEGPPPGAGVQCSPGPCPGARGIPGLAVTVDPPALVLVQGQEAVLNVSLRNDGNATLNLTLDALVREPPVTRSGPGGGPLAVGGPAGPAGGNDTAFALTLSARSVQLAPGADAHLTLHVRAAVGAANGTRKMATMVLAEAPPPGNASGEPPDGPPAGQAVDVPLRIGGVISGQGSTPRAVPTPAPEGDEAMPTPGPSAPAAVLGAGLAAVACRAARGQWRKP